MQTQKNNSTYFPAYLYSAGTQHGEPASIGCYGEQADLATATTGKNAGEWTGTVEIGTEDVPWQ